MKVHEKDPKSLYDPSKILCSHCTRLSVTYDAVEQRACTGFEFQNDALCSFGETVLFQTKARQKYYASVTEAALLCTIDQCFHM